MRYCKILKDQLILHRWYLGRGRHQNVGLWNGEVFLTIGRKFIIEHEHYYEDELLNKPDLRTFKPFLLIDEGTFELGNRIPKERLFPDRWYLGREKDSNVALWDGEHFLNIDIKKSNELMKIEPYYEASSVDAVSGSFQPLALIDEGTVEPIGRLDRGQINYGKSLLIGEEENAYRPLFEVQVLKFIDEYKFKGEGPKPIDREEFEDICRYYSLSPRTIDSLFDRSLISLSGNDVILTEDGEKYIEEKSPRRSRKTARRLPEAIEVYDKVLGVNPQYAKSWYNKGVALAKLRRFLEAIETYSKALEVKPKYVEAWRSKGVALEELKKFPEAIEAYGNFVKLCDLPKYTKYKYNGDVSKVKDVIRQLCEKVERGKKE